MEDKNQAMARRVAEAAAQVGGRAYYVGGYVRDRLRDRTDLDTRRAFLVDTCPDDHLASIAREVLRQDGRFQEIIEAKAGCTIFCHCGPGTLGVIFLRKA